RPFDGRDRQAARFPVRARELLPLVPHERIPLSGKNDDMRSGAMTMSPRIGAHGIFLDMRTDGVGRNMEQDALGTFPAGAVFHQAEAGNIRDEIRIPGSMTLNLFSLAAEVTILAAEPI